MVSDNRVTICGDRYTLGTGGKAKGILVVGSSPATFRPSLCLRSWEDNIDKRREEGAFDRGQMARRHESLSADRRDKSLGMLA